jgi:hypothetical protein
MLRSAAAGSNNRITQLAISLLPRIGQGPFFGMEKDQSDGSFSRLRHAADSTLRRLKASAITDKIVR